MTELKVENKDATKSSNSRKYLDDDNMKKMKIQQDSVEDLSVEMMWNNNNNRGETQLVCDIIVIGMRSMHERE